MKSPTFLLLLAAALSSLIVALVLGVMWMETDLHGHHTAYCPLSHQRGDLRSCYVLDEEGGRVLIQHAELDGNRCYFEIRNNDKSTFFAMPESIVQFAPQGYSAQLLEGVTDAVEIDGERTELARIAAPTF